MGKAEAHPNRYHFSYSWGVGKVAIFPKRRIAGLVGKVEAVIS
jgi:hypothetical protein